MSFLQFDIVVVLMAYALIQAESFSLLTTKPLIDRISIHRKDFIVSTIGILCTPYAAQAKQSEVSPQDELVMIQEASSTLKTLLDNWDKATIDCTYADVPRELLETKNKDQLLEKASTFALFDKSTSIVSCKKTNKIVRDYIGVTGKGPLVNVDKRMMKKNVVASLDPDELDDYYAQVELFQGSIARAASLSYTSGVADFDAVNNFEKGEQNTKDDSNLEQARRSIIDAYDAIRRIVVILEKSLM